MPSEELGQEIIDLSQKENKLYCNPSMVWGKGNLPFDFFQLTNNSIILRQGEFGKAALFSLTIEFFGDGKAKFLCPINYQNIEHINEHYHTQETVEILYNIWEKNKSNNSDMRFIDVSQIFGILVTCISFYRQWIGDTKLLKSVKAALILRGMLNISPVFDSKECATYIEKYSLPTLTSDVIFIPNDTSNRYIYLNYEEEVDPSIILVILTGLALGLSYKMSTHVLANTGTNKSDGN